jgi:hypothetical protein
MTRRVDDIIRDELEKMAFPLSLVLPWKKNLKTAGDAL